MNRYTVTLTEDERKSLHELSSKGKHNSQQILNALILLNCDKSEWNVNHSTNEEISRVLNISTKKIDGDAEAHLVALSCSQPPEGFARWSLRLLADKAVELGYFEDISHETVRRTLKKRNQTLAKERMDNSP